MSTCRDCYHYDLCLENAKEELKSAGLNFDLEDFSLPLNKCEFFKDKSKIVELPCAIGETVYVLAEPCGKCECFNNPMCEEYIEKCRHCDKTEIITLPFDMELYAEFGKTVFTSKEEAERALNNIKNKGEIKND